MCSGETDSHNMSSAVLEPATAHTPSPSVEDLSIPAPVTESAYQDSGRSSSPLDVADNMDPYHKSDLDPEHIENSMSPSKDCDYATPRYLSPMNHVGGLLNNNKGVSVETSKLLRGILQGKDKHGGMMNGGGHGMDHTEDNPFMMNKIIQRDSPGIIRNGSFDTDLDSMRSATPGEFSSEELSDHEVSGMSQSEGAEKLNDEEGSPNEVPEVKKLRVESIISNMSRPTPLKATDQPTERRHKRKQFTPQQHDANLDEPMPKVRRVEKDVLRKQLKLMQSQLSDMQQKYLELFDQPDSSDTSDMELTDALTLKKLNGNCNPEDRSFKSHSIASLTGELTPSHIFKQASRLVMDQEKANKEDCPDSADLDTLAKMLKREISSSVGSLVDNIVSQFIQKQKQMMEKPAGKENAEQQPAPPKPVRESPKPSSPVINIMPREVEAEHHHHSHKEMPLIPKPTRTKVTDKLLPPIPDPRPRNFADLARHHPALFPPPPYFHGQLPPPMQPLFPKEPEQTEALALVVNTPKKKRTKVTDTRLSPRAAKALLQEGLQMPDMDREKHLRDIPPLLRDMASHHPGLPPHFPHPGLHHPDFHNPLVPVTLPTSVAIPNPSLQHSEVLAMYSSQADHHPSAFSHDGRPLSQSPLIGDHGSPNMAHTPSEMSMNFLKSESEMYEQGFGETYDGMQLTVTLTPMHLRKAKLMFFYVRYPSSAILKIYFPDVKFNKNNTAQLVKWFSNFREFYYIQMEKYARQSIAEGVKNVEDLVVSTDSELYRVLNLHYNRNNQIEVPENFRLVVQSTLREFYKSVFNGKDVEQSWKKAIYKVIARMDDQLPEFFKSPNWMEQLNDL